VAFDGHGKRLWSDIDRGHMDVGWVATREASTGEKLALAIRIGAKSAGPQGFARKGVEEFVYDVFSGAKMRLPFSLFGTLPVDANGDGTHELVRGSIGGDGALLNWNGAVLGKVDGPVVHVSKVLDRPGEQIVTYTANGSIKVWADLNARDSTAALSRYQHPAYRANQRLTACGYNLVNLGGL
jgi:hypothetical protein